LPSSRHRAEHLRRLVGVVEIVLVQAIYEEQIVASAPSEWLDAIGRECIVRFVPSIARGEAANLGVIVVDDAVGATESAFVGSTRERASALARGFNVEMIARSVDRLQRHAASARGAGVGQPHDGCIRTSAQLRTLAGAMKNQIQLSEPRPYRARPLKAAADELYRHLVHPIGAPASEERAHNAV
jgi:hypothetical protein